MQSRFSHCVIVILVLFVGTQAIDISGVVVDSVTQETLDSAKICLDLDPNECVSFEDDGSFQFVYTEGAVRHLIRSTSNCADFTVHAWTFYTCRSRCSRRALSGTEHNGQVCI